MHRRNNNQKEMVELVETDSGNSSHDSGNSSHDSLPNRSKCRQPTCKVDKTLDANLSPAPRMMKGGLRDRPILSWIRIMFVTSFWWLFVGGFFALSFFFMEEILQQFDGAQPYFVRNFLKYPGILHQPGLNIKCSSTSCEDNLLIVQINKIYNWRPLPYTKEDNPETDIHVGKANMKTDLAELGKASFVEDNLVYVTCNGRKEADKDNLKGMKIRGQPGFDAAEFPWLGKQNSTWLEPVLVDVGSSKVVKEAGSRVVVFLECRAWARNIELQQQTVDKKVPNGGGLAVLCFENGKIINFGTRAIKDCVV